MSVYLLLKTMNNVPMPRMAKPATPKPITVPPVKETAKAFFKEVRAACVVRTLALVAMLMPIQPANAENTAPMMNAMAINQSECSALPSNSISADQPNKIAATTTNTDKTRHSARKKACAPRAM